jgi:hypothetical protein
MIAVIVVGKTNWERNVFKSDVTPSNTIRPYVKLAVRKTAKRTHLRAKPLPPVQLLNLAAYNEFFYVLCRFHITHRNDSICTMVVLSILINGEHFVPQAKCSTYNTFSTSAKEPPEPKDPIDNPCPPSQKEFLNI